MKFNIDRKYIDDGLVTEKQHPTEPYLIYNYTPKTQFSKAWDEVTIQCRGLIVHKDTREIVARPFSKFFNYEEHIEKGLTLPAEMPIVYSKFDGSLGILYFTESGEPMIATRGSFVSDQARWATGHISLDKSAYDSIMKLDRSYTHLFEIIYPENRIVVNYGWDGLVHLASINTETGVSIVPDSDFPLAAAQPFSSYEELKGRNKQNEEGYVLHYPSSDLRLKIKFEDYVRLHKIMTGLSEIGVWEMLRDGKDVADIVGETPDEMHEWLQKVITTLLSMYVDIKGKAEVTVALTEALDTRKRKAEFIMDNNKDLSGVCFSMLDEKDYSKLIWRMVRPVGSSTFRVDIDR